MKDEEMTIIEKTTIYMENYSELVRYITEAVSESSQTDPRYNISAEKAYLQSIRECRAESVILLEHINKALQSLKADAIASGEEYKYTAFEAVYVDGKSYEEVSRELGTGRNSPKRWCKVMLARLSIKLFGAKAIETKIYGEKKDG